MVMLHPSPTFLLLIVIALTTLLSTHVHSFDCKSENFRNKITYTNCTTLPTLNSTLHYTFNPKNSTLSVAFMAPPATPNGWVAWAINPTGTGMIGCQAFIAFKDSMGKMTVKTYNISSYSSIAEGKIDFDVVESSAEFSNGTMMIFATVKLPENMMEINQVWQVGSSVMDGVPMKHAFSPDNLKAMGKLQLEVKASNVTNPGGTTGAGNNIKGGIYGVIFFACLLGLF